jgi:nicotinate phosphoribosyltransferase
MRAVSYLPKRYIEYLATFKLDPETQVIIDYDESTRDLAIKVHGLWVETIIYEIPLLALISEAYFSFIDTDWNFDGQRELAAAKAKSLLDNGCVFSEFGTRRRRSLKAQDLVLQGIHDAVASHEKGKQLYRGTSNVYFAKKYDVKPVGTVAHEWMMGIAAYTQDYEHANKIAMDHWINTVGPSASGFALTDTFGTDNFLKCMSST